MLSSKCQRRSFVFDGRMICPEGTVFVQFLGEHIQNSLCGNDFDLGF